MSNRHRATLKAVFRDPVSATIVWAEVERMLVHYGARIKERKGSGIAVKLNGTTTYFHRPHPHKEAKEYQIRDVRAFLTKMGIEP
jgi:HicA toxin of bacterial toxin-antitoxin,